MAHLTHLELRKKFLEFWKNKNHVIIPSSSLIPENDPTTLFTGSGMQPLIPYLLGQPHPLGKRLVNIQKCFRGQDIEEVGDNRHDSFFEMMGNWSLGDYFKKEQLTWYWEFLTEVLKLPKEKLYVSCFAGNSEVPRDQESEKIWLDLGVAKDHIFFYGVDKNWWSRSGAPDKMPVGEIGGPDSEVFFEFTHVPHDKKFGEKCHPNCDCGRFVEIGNSVFIQYQKQADGSFKELPQKNVDFGGGLERTLAALNNEPDIFKSELFSEIIEEIKKITNKTYSDDNLEPMRIIADHIKSAVFLILDGIKPSNKDQGYVLRKLLRRSAVKFHQIGGSLSSDNLFGIVDRGVLYTYDGEQGVNRGHDRDLVNSVLTEETGKFLKTMDQGLKLIDKLSPFDLFQTYGFPPELTMELLKKRGVELDWNKFEDEMKLHREKSRTASAGMFKGGLADQSEIVTKYHTATHLLHAALRQVLGEEVHQAGSNLTAERLRFDFTFTRKLTEEEIEKITEIVNDQIKKGLEQKKEIMTYDEAIKSGALAFFKDKYPEKVTVYSFGNFSKEICGGPHVANTNLILEPANTSRLAVQDEQAPRRDSEPKNTSQLFAKSLIGKIKIYKQESVSAGVRRIYAQIQN